MARPRQPLLTRQRIVAAASALVDAEGLESFSTRRLAAELGVQGPSLYNHFATKDDILDAVADSITAEVDISHFGRMPWPEALRRWAYHYRSALAAHSNIVPFLAQGPRRRPAALAMADVVYGSLIAAGWPPATATYVAASMRSFIVGSALGSFARGYVADPELYATDYPHLTQAHRLADHQTQVDERAFALGVDAMIEGLVALYERAGYGPTRVEAVPVAPP